MFREEGGRPNDARGFVHKRLLGGIKSFVGGGFNPLSGITGFLAPPKRAARPVAPRTTTARPSLVGAQGKEVGRQLKFGDAIPFVGPTTITRRGFRAPADRCAPPSFLDPSTGRCVRRKRGLIPFIQRVIPGGETGLEPGRPLDDAAASSTPVGDAVMGRYGAALEPGVMMIERSVCLRGMTLGNDGLCYNKGAITNKERQWPRGRRPLLTGGDMRAIGIAARAGSKLERTTKRLRTLGMMKALPKGRARAHAHAKPIAAVSV